MFMADEFQPPVAQLTVSAVVHLFWHQRGAEDVEAELAKVTAEGKLAAGALAAGVATELLLVLQRE